MNITLSPQAAQRLKDLSKAQDLPMSHIIENLVMGTEESPVSIERQTPTRASGDTELLKKVDGVLAHIDRVKEKYGLEW